jgi:hypothetical protein
MNMAKMIGCKCLDEIECCLGDTMQEGRACKKYILLLDMIAKPEFSALFLGL